MMDTFLETVHYAQSMETECARVKKELNNLQYLNKFLLISQKKKDDMISYLFEENRALKKEVLELQKALEKWKHKKFSKNFPINSPEKNLDASFSVNLNPKIISPPSLHNINTPNNVVMGKKMSNFNLSLLNDNFSRRKTKIYEDNLAYKNLLNMNLSKSKRNPI